MPSWWEKSSSKDAKKKSNKGSLINTILKKLRIVLEGKSNRGSGGSGKQHCDAKHASRSPVSPSLPVSRCESFAGRPPALPLPLPRLQPNTKQRDDSGNVEAAEAEVSKSSKPIMFFPLPKPLPKPDHVDAEAAVGTASVSTGKSTDSNNTSDSFLRSPQASGHKNGKKAAMNSPSSGKAIELPAHWPEGKHEVHRLPLPPIKVPNTYLSYSSKMTLVPRSPRRAENPSCHGPRWKKGKLLGRGTFGHVYVGFDSESGEMCAMKEVTLLSDDAKSKESAEQLRQEVALLSRLRHPNIVQYLGSEVVGDKLYIYLEYVSGGSIYKLLRDFGQLGEAAIRSYTQQILSGLAYLHARHTIHRDIKGANLLVDPNGRRVKLADFGMGKHISEQPCQLSFKGSPYWMAPEIIKNSNGCTVAVDIWSLGCTVLEMATTKPPWSQFEGVAAIFKIGHSKELPDMPPNLSDDGKDFIRRCLQRNPLDRPSAAQLLEHPFVKNAAPLERPLPCIEPVETMPEGYGHAYNPSYLDRKGAAIKHSRGPNIFSGSSDAYVPRNIPSAVPQVTNSPLHPLSPRRLSPRPCASPNVISSSTTRPTGGGGAIPLHLSKQPPID